MSYRLMHVMLWPVLKMARLSCRHFAELSGARMDRRLTWSEGLRFRVHSMVCAVCRRLPGQFVALRELVRAGIDTGDTCGEGQEHPEVGLNDEVRERILRALTEESKTEGVGDGG